jgi:prepilin-type N-terminal cleavage/methylation domain-containing protein
MLTGIINPTGFTLIELLVVIGIIALLLAILLPVAARVRAQLRAVVCQSNLRQWGMTLNAYAQDNLGRFPTDGSGGCGVWLLRGTFIRSADANAPEDSPKNLQE